MDWKGVKPSITYGPKENRVKVYIGSLGRWVREDIIPSSDEGEEEVNEEKTERHWLEQSIRSSKKLNQVSG